MASSGSAAGRRLARQAGVVGRDGDGPGLDVGLAVADLEQPARTDAQERVPAEALAALDGLEQVGGTAVVEAKQGADRGLEIGRAGSAQQDRVGGTRESLRLRQTERIGGGHPGRAPENQERPVVSGTKGRTFRGATLIRRVPHSLDPRLPGPFPLVVVPAHTSRRVSGSTLRQVLVPFTARSSRCGREYGRVVGEPSSRPRIRRAVDGMVGLEAHARHHRERRVASESGVVTRPPAQDEHAASIALDPTGVRASATQPRGHRYPLVHRHSLRQCPSSVVRLYGTAGVARRRRPRRAVAARTAPRPAHPRPEGRRRAR